MHNSIEGEVLEKQALLETHSPLKILDLPPSLSRANLKLQNDFFGGFLVGNQNQEKTSRAIALKLDVQKRLKGIESILLTNCVGIEATMDALESLNDCLQTISFALDHHLIEGLPPGEPPRN